MRKIRVPEVVATSRAVALHDEVKASFAGKEGSPSIANLIVRVSSNGQGYAPRAIPKWVTSILLFEASNGKAGWHAWQMRQDDALDMLEDKETPEPVKVEIAKLLLTHPDSDTRDLLHRNMQKIAGFGSTLQKARKALNPDAV